MNENVYWILLAIFFASTCASSIAWIATLIFYKHPKYKIVGLTNKEGEHIGFSVEFENHHKSMFIVSHDVKIAEEYMNEYLGELAESG